jgi:hypothetical protein
MTEEELKIFIQKYGIDNTATRLCCIYHNWDKLDLINYASVIRLAEYANEPVETRH